MALPDPYPLTVGGTYGLTGGTAVNYNRIEPGLFVLSSSTADEPSYMTVKSNVRNSGKASDYLIRFDRHKNVAGAAIGSSDAQLTSYLVIRCDFGYFTVADVKDQLSLLGNWAYNSGQLDKVLRGER